MKQAFKIKHLLVCEDIRHELRNKFTFVGTYGPGITINDRLPAMLRLAFRIEIMFGSVGQLELSLVIKGPDGQNKVEGSKLNVTIHKIDRPSALPVGPFPIQITDYGQHTVYLTANGRQQRAGVFYIDRPEQSISASPS